MVIAFIGEAGGGSDTFKTISVSGQDDVDVRQCDRCPYIDKYGGISIATAAASDTINLRPMEAKLQLDRFGVDGIE